MRHNLEYLDRLDLELIWFVENKGFRTVNNSDGTGLELVGPRNERFWVSCS